MRKAFAIWMLLGLPVLADSVAATRSWVSNRVAEARAEWRGEIVSATNPVPSWISAAEGRVDGRIAGATNGLPERIASVTNGLPERIASVTNGLPAKMAALTNGLPEAIAGSTNGLPERIASVTNGLPERIASVTNGLPERVASVTNGLPEAIAAATNGIPGLIASSTNGVMGEVNAATGALWTAIGNIEGMTADIGALARTNDLPTKVSQLENDAGYLTNRVDVSNLARASGVFPDWTSKGTWSEGEFCTWKGVVYRFTGAGDPSAQPDISPVSWAVSDVGTAIAGARPDMSSLTNPIPAWIAASTNGLPERIAAATNGLPAKIAAVTNGLPERIASVTNGLPELVAASTNGIPEAIAASTNPVPEWIAASTNGLPALIASSVRAQVAGLDSKAATRLVSADGYRWIDGTGAVWQVVHRALWGGGSADAPVGSGSFGAEGWELVWTPEYDGAGTGSWDLYRTLSGNGPLVAHFTADGLPHQEGAPFVLTLQECTVGGSAAYVGQQTDNGWYQIADSAGSLHFVSPLTNVVTVVRATNYVDRLTLSDELIRSNDVVSIVTETSESGITDWELRGIPEGFGEDLFGEEVPSPWGIYVRAVLGDRTVFCLTGGEGYEVDEVYCVVTNFDDSVLSLQFANTTGIGDTNAITAVRSVKVSTNVLGFARLTDVTNIVTKPYVESLGIEAGISAQTATNIAEGAMENLRPFVASVATQVLYTSTTEIYDTWHVPEYEGYSDLAYRAVWSNGRWYGFTINAEDGYGDLFISSGAGNANATTVTMSDAYGSVTWNRTGTATNDVPVYDIVGRQYDYMGGMTYVDGPTGDWFDIQTNSWHVWIADHVYYSPFTGTNVRDCRIFETANPTNWTPVTSLIRIPEGATSITGTVTWVYIDASHYTNVQVVLTPRSLNALGLARFSDLDKYAVPRQDLARTVRTAVNMAADYLWDPLDEVCYRRQMSGGFLDYVAVTNIDVTLPENWQALEALEAERRSQQ